MNYTINIIPTPEILNKVGVLYQPDVDADGRTFDAGVVNFNSSDLIDAGKINGMLEGTLVHLRSNGMMLLKSITIQGGKLIFTFL